MTDLISRKEVIDCITNNWGSFVRQFQQLTPDAQAAYLQQQGYAHFGDLLAHVVAWWQAGVDTIQQLIADPDMPSPKYDVDAFNAEAVRGAAGRTEGELIQQFEAQRETMLALVHSLSEDSFQGKRINKRLRIEVCGHFEEHAISK